MAPKKGEGWGEPENIGAPVNTPGWELSCAVTANGSIYFISLNTTTGKRGCIAAARWMENFVHLNTSAIQPPISTMPPISMFYRRKISATTLLQIPVRRNHHWQRHPAAIRGATCILQLQRQGKMDDAKECREPDKLCRRRDQPLHITRRQDVVLYQRKEFHLGSYATPPHLCQPPNTLAQSRQRSG